MTSIAHAMLIGLACLCVANGIVGQNQWWALAGLILFLVAPMIYRWGVRQ